MKIKGKLTLGIVFLFVEFLVIALFGAHSIYRISQQTERIMKDNNLSIQYAENMLLTIDRINELQLAVLFHPSQMTREGELTALYGRFEEYLSKESKNVTEPGEKELLQSVTEEYRGYAVPVARMQAVEDKSTFYFQERASKYNHLKSLIYRISDLNMEAIAQKNERVNQYERRSYVTLTVLASVCFLLSFAFLFNFPGWIAEPIRRLSESLKGIAAGNYDVLPGLESGGEFKEMEDAVRRIAGRLKELERTRPDAVISGRERLAATIDRTLGMLRAGGERLRNLEPRKILDEQLRQIETLDTALEQARHELRRAQEPA